MCGSVTVCGVSIHAWSLDTLLVAGTRRRVETKVLSRIIQSAPSTQPVLAALECSSRQDTLDTRGDSVVRETAANLGSSLDIKH